MFSSSFIAFRLKGNAITVINTQANEWTLQFGRGPSVCSVILNDKQRALLLKSLA